MRPFNVLIVDDEETICRGVASKLARLARPWIGAVHWTDRASQARAKIEELSIDILVTDIRMPEISGLEVIRSLRGARPRLQHIVLSGYDDFAYVRTALNLEVCDYLLKPVASSELAAALDKARGHLVEDVEARSRSDTLMLENVFQRALSSSRTGPELWEAARRLLPFRYHRIVVSNLDRPAAGDPRRFAASLADGDGGKIVAFYDADERLCLIASCDGNRYDLRSIHGKLAVECGLSRRDILLAASRPFEHLELMRETHARARSWLLRMRLIGETGLSVTPELPEPSLIPQAVEVAFGDAAMAGDSDRIRELIETCFCSETVLAHSFEHLEAVYRGACAGMSVVGADARDVAPETTSPSAAASGAATDERGRDAASPANLGSFESLDALRAYLRRFGERSRGRDRSESLAKMAERYVRAHYDEDLDMSTVAEYLGLSYSYFGRLFKREVGKSFPSYVSEFRLRRAAELLQDPRVGVGEVAHRVGYTSRKTFVRQFKRQFGTIPSERPTVDPILGHNRQN